MGAKIERMSDDMMQTLKDSGATEFGKCYENCVIAVLAGFCSTCLVLKDTARDGKLHAAPAVEAEI